MKVAHEKVERHVTVSQNKTKVGLKAIGIMLFLMRLSSQNKTKVGLKDLIQRNFDVVEVGQNKTKVGLKV